jgi:hypothetical protein
MSELDKIKNGGFIDSVNFGDIKLNTNGDNFMLITDESFVVDDICKPQKLPLVNNLIPPLSLTIAMSKKSRHHFERILLVNLPRKLKKKLCGTRKMRNKIQKKLHLIITNELKEKTNNDETRKRIYEVCEEFIKII